LRGVATVGTVTQGRRFVAYGVGAGKSGTLSLAQIFGANFRVGHEPESERLAPLVQGVIEGGRRARLRRYLRRRDRRLGLELDSSNLNAWIVADLLDLHPQARFILIWRHPEQWLDSLINHVIPRTPVPHWQALRDATFGGPPHRPGEEALQERGLYSLDGYLGSWVRRHEVILSVVPAAQLLVVRTDDLSASLPTLAAFTGVDLELLDPTPHAHRTRRKFDVLSEIDPGLLSERIDEHGADLVTRLERLTAST
jgi:hypothetical protein